jgi:Tfp pilus assembly protein PilV
MQKAWSITNNQNGFSVVEVLLAATVFAMLTTAVIGALVYGRSSTAGSGDRTRANLIADEGIEAVRSIRDANYANLTDGTYGAVQSGNTWTLSGTNDTSDIFTRSITVASNGSNRKTITSNVTWTGAQGSGQVSVISELTNWRAALAKLWSAASQYGGVDVTGTIAGWKIATSGSYAYMVRKSSTGPNFIVVNISTPTAPTVTGTLTLAGTPTNIAISGNYAYISNSSTSGELQIVNVATPTVPSLSGTYNASGTAGGGLGVYAVGTTVYLTRAANSGTDEFVIVNAATPSSPTRVGGYGLAVAMNEVYVSGTVAYVATGSDTQEVLPINIATPSAPAAGTAINLSGTTDATTITGYGTRLFVGQGTSFHSISTSTPLAPTLSGTLALPSTINDLTPDSGHNYIDVGISNTTAEFQVVNVTAPAAPVVLKVVDTTGAFNLTGVAYNSTYDIVVGTDTNTAQEIQVLGPN